MKIELLKIYSRKRGLIILVWKQNSKNLINANLPNIKTTETNTEASLENLSNSFQEKEYLQKENLKVTLIFVKKGMDRFKRDKYIPNEVENNCDFIVISMTASYCYLFLDRLFTEEICAIEYSIELTPPRLSHIDGDLNGIRLDYTRCKWKICDIISLEFKIQLWFLRDFDYWHGLPIRNYLCIFHKNSTK